MAARNTWSRNRPRSRGGAGRLPWPLAVLAVLIVALYTTMAAIGTWTPRLAVDLAGGVSAIYTAKPATGQKTISQGDMGEAVAIFQDRVDGFGVSEASVTQQGAGTIQVEVPGSTKDAEKQLQLIGQTAKLYFRPVLEIAAATPTPTSTASPSATGTGAATPTPSGSATPTPAGTGATLAPKAGSSATSTAPAGQSLPLTTVHEAATAGATTAPATKAATTPATAPATGSATAPAATASPTPSTPAEVQEQQAITTFGTLDCDNAKNYLSTVGTVAPSAYLATCGINNDPDKYLLGPEEVLGTDVTTARADPVMSGGSNPVATGAWQVDLSFNAAGAKAFGTVTTSLYSNCQAQQTPCQLAVALDGIVQSAPQINQGPITGGQATITGTFSEQQATELATVLSYGALPLSFTISQQSVVSPTLGGSQLEGGLIAGAIGLLLVFMYVIAYYRGLSIVAISSLLIAASITYATAVLLGPLMGFTLSLAGVAGLIVAIGITADSFVVFFERIRDEVREGRTLRSGVDHGWVRARRTIVKSDFVSFLAAAVLYIYTVGEVQGFAFTLGLTTVVDIVVVFLFTKPLLTMLARTEFFGGGHKWSGLDPERLGGQAVNWRSSKGSRMTVAERRRAAQSGESGDDPEDDTGQDGDVDSSDSSRVEA